MSDIRVENHGTIMLVIPESDAAREWIDENVHTEGWQWIGPALAIEPRYLPELLQGASDDGLQIEV